MPLLPKGAIADIPTRKHCSVCKRWLLTCINFRPRAWLEDGSRPIHISSTCNSCHKRKQRQYHKPKLSAEYLRQRADQESFLLDGKLNAVEFRIWLTHRCQEIGIGNVAASVGVSQRMVYTYVIGKYTKHHNGQVRQYAVNYMQLATVDKYAQALGYQWGDIYSHIAYMDRTVVRQRLWRKGLLLGEQPQEARLRSSPSQDPIGDYRRKKKARRAARRASDVTGSSLDETTTEDADLQHKHKIQQDPLQQHE